MSHGAHTQFAEVTGADPAACVLGLTNGFWPNGTTGNGTFKFGFYVPTTMEKGLCQNAYHPWIASAEYGRWTSYFFLAGLAVFALFNTVRRVNHLSRAIGQLQIAPAPARASAVARWLSYPQLSLRLPFTSARVGLMPLGPLLLCLIFTAFTNALVWGIRPFYRPNNFGTPPLGLRAEWVATAVIPWILAAAMKSNVLAALSGISPSRLMSLHKSVPWLCLLFSIVHAGAMIIRARRQGWSWSHTLSVSEFYWNGFPPLAALAWLCVMSLGPIRRRWYEAFFITHIVAAIVFIIFCYIHFARLLDSWVYMHASMVIWGSAIAFRTLSILFCHSFFTTALPQASLDALPSSALRLSVRLPLRRRWAASQYVLLRFPALRPWESHPFTVVSLPSGAADADGDGMHDMVFVIRPYDGLTARLFSMAESRPRTLSVIVDGPYGGEHLAALLACDAVLFVAGGSGMSSVKPLADQLLASQRAGRSCVRALQVVWAVQHSDAFGWYELPEERTGSAEKGEGVEVKVERYVTREEQGDKVRVTGRPDVAACVEQAVQRHRGRLGVCCCGPWGMMLQVRNAVAAAQQQILGGGCAADECVLFEESYTV